LHCKTTSFFSKHKTLGHAEGYLLYYLQFKPLKSILCAKLQTMTTEDDDYRKTIEDLIPGIPESSTVAPP
jgi:hypothetical protein